MGVKEVIKVYCSSCGAPSTPGLSFCNRCGANLGLIKDQGEIKPPASPFDSLMESIFWVTVFGLGAVVGGVAALKALQFRELFIIAYMILSSAAFLGIYGMHVLQFRRLTSAAKKSSSTKDVGTKELGPAQARLLSEPMPSVTEHTTRAFDPIYSERKSE